MEENKSQIIIYQTENGETKLDVRFHWQKIMQNENIGNLKILNKK